MRVLFRADASNEIGTGHVMRCLTLADAVGERGGESQFLCRELLGHLESVIQERGYNCVLLQADARSGALGTSVRSDAKETQLAADAYRATHLVLDHYFVDERWEIEQRTPLMVIDDLADRRRECSLLLNQNLGASRLAYIDLVDEGTDLLLGPAYALLRPEFARLRDAAIQARADRAPRNLFVSLGGADAPNATGWVLDALSGLSLFNTAEITVVMGGHAPHLDAVREQVGEMSGDVHVLAGTSKVAQLMAEADLAIGAGGTTSWERCAMGLGTIIVVLADNQEDIAAQLNRAGAASTVALHDSEALCAEVERLWTRDDARRSMHARAAALCEGDGAGKVAAALERITRR